MALLACLIVTLALTCNPLQPCANVPHYHHHHHHHITTISSSSLYYHDIVIIIIIILPQYHHRHHHYHHHYIIIFIINIIIISPGYPCANAHYRTDCGLQVAHHTPRPLPYDNSSWDISIWRSVCVCVTLYRCSVCDIRWDAVATAIKRQC